MSSSTQETTVPSHWAHLPTPVLTDVLSLLDKEDRRNASAVCKHWRQNCFQRRWWNSIKFTIKSEELDKARFLTSTFGKTVTYAKIVLKSVSANCLEELIKLLRNLKINNNLRDLVVEYSPGDCEQRHHFTHINDRSDDLKEVTNLLNACLPRLSGFTAACMGALNLSVGTILKNVNPSLLRRIEFTAMPSYSQQNRLDQALFQRLTKLEELAIDQQTITDELLDVVESCTGLKKLVIYHRSYFRNVDPSGRAVYFHRDMHRRPSRRFVQCFKSHCMSHTVSIGKSGQEIVVKRVLLF